MSQHPLEVAEQDKGDQVDFKPVLAATLVDLVLEALEQAISHRLQHTLDHDLVELSVHDRRHRDDAVPGALGVPDWVLVECVSAAESPGTLNQAYGGPEVESASHKGPLRLFSGKKERGEEG